MPACGQQLTGVTGTAIGTNRILVTIQAIRHMIGQGHQSCSPGSCDAGTCQFALNDITGHQVVDLEGGQVQVTVTGDGKCVCA